MALPDRARPNQVAGKDPLISVVIACRNEASAIEDCLRSLLAQEGMGAGFEVLVVDGASTDGTRTILDRLAERDPRLRVVDNPSRISASALNLGILAARGRYIAIVGAHARYSSDYLAACLAEAERTGAENVGGAMFVEGRGPIGKAIQLAHHSRFSVGGARWHDPTFEGYADTVFGGFYRRDVFERIGLFDETLVRTEDDEFNLRLQRTGGRIFISPRIRSWYQPRESLRRLLGQYTQYGYWKVPVIVKHRRVASLRHLAPGVCLAGWMAAVLVGLVRRRLLLIPAAAGAAYASTNLLVSLQLVRRQRPAWRSGALLPVVFACMHFGYGYGFLRGVFDFLIRGQGTGRFTRLTR